MSEKSGKIWVHAEVVEDKIVNVAFELLSKARDLAEAMGGGTEVEATLIGSGLEKEAARLAEWGAKTIYLADDPGLRMYSPLTFVPILADLAAKHQPEIYLIGATSTGSALGPAVAARLKTGTAAHCVDLRIDEEKKLVSLVPSFGGKVIGEILCPGKNPQMASVKPGIFTKKDPVPVPVRIEKLDASSWEKIDTQGLKPVNVVRRPPQGLPLNEADVVVCGGFGIGSQENWQLLEKLAQYLGGATACTRPAVDEGWSGEHCMVGTSGQSIRPKVYIGFGISGATHHICGMNESGVVINVNRDAEAPIFQVSDVRIVAEVNSILPLLAEAVKPKASW
ncbi:MAG: electron transfer flavoprotein subunit alpha/FixB family protein [Synergistaceae bacterium]|jgi:electron transfer flavoprotein alpha subunit|nr:electron transfer flavoprotein subunit alpha/FixB family protein [Synergistaceae bacterium]